MKELSKDIEFLELNAGKVPEELRDSLNSVIRKIHELLAIPPGEMAGDPAIIAAQDGYEGDN
jgi:hypothetical protein